MQALPYLQLRESESPSSSEKKNYRLSLHETSAKTTNDSDGQTRSVRNVNRPDYSWESPSQFEGSSSIVFGDVPHLRTTLPSPSPSKVIKPSLKLQHQPCHPEWVEPLGVWLTNRRKCNSYEKFTRHVKLLRRTSDMFLDPCPHVPRCSHERTLSALRRQKQRFKSEEEIKAQERQIRIIEKVQQFRELWEEWTNKTKSVGEEHEKRLNSFKKSRDGYTDPDEIIRKKREERIQREKMIRFETEKKREEWLRNKRFRLPKIIVTYYEDKQEKRPESRGSNLEDQIKLPKLGNSDNDKGNVKDGDSQGFKGDRLVLPEVERYCPEYYSEFANSTQRSEDTEVLPDNKTTLEVGTGEHSLDNNIGVDMQNASLECNGRENLETDVIENTRNVREDEVLENKRANGLKEDFETNSENVVDGPLDEAVLSDELSDSGNRLSSRKQTTKPDEPFLLHAKQGDISEKRDYQFNADSKNGREVPEAKGTKGELDNLNKEDNHGMKVNYLVPPSVQSTAAGSDSSTINEADDTASLMAAFIPVAMGVGNGVIPNDAMRASSVFDRYHVPSQARLHNTKKGKNAGAWRPKINDKKQYLEVDLGAITRMTQVSTQGYPTASGVKVHIKDKCWVESYTLAFSTDGVQWQQYTENGVVKFFQGNRDNNSVVINSISNPVEARFVRFIPESWKNSIAFRVEVYGEVTEPDLTTVTPTTSSLAAESVTESVHEVILEEDEEVEQLVCDVGEELDQLDAWEEDIVCAVTETNIQIESQVTTGILPPSPSTITELTVQGEKQTPKSKRKSKKPKQVKPGENEGKKKTKKKTFREENKKDPLVTSLSLLEEVEEEEVTLSPEEGEQEKEETEFKSPTLPEIPKRPESVRGVSSDRKRSFDMFPDRKGSSEDSQSKPRRRRAKRDDSIRNELLRQQVAEDRRKKLAAAMEKPKRDIQALNPVYDSYKVNSDLDDFLAKYCILSEGQINLYRRVFNNHDDNKDGFLFPEEVLEALESVNSNLLSDAHINYIYRVMELCDCSLDAGADFKLFSVVAAFSQRLAVLDDFAKVLILNLDFKELDLKLQKAKRLFLCYVDEAKKTISLEELVLGLTAGGLTTDQKEQTLKILGRTAALDFLDFLTYIPLFIHIHDHILQDPLGPVVYRDMLTVQ